MNLSHFEIEKKTGVTLFENKIVLEAMIDNPENKHTYTHSENTQTHAYRRPISTTDLKRNYYIHFIALMCCVYTVDAHQKPFSTLNTMAIT